ncbi:MAG: type IV secretion system DNA-binding domain-containing protein [Phycisphaerae bacterium]|nr:type IV secretion system DNA-binding domain-containing protein [Phycisphaerae bacterium]
MSNVIKASALYLLATALALLLAGALFYSAYYLTYGVIRNAYPHLPALGSFGMVVFACQHVSELLRTEQPFGKRLRSILNTALLVGSSIFVAIVFSAVTRMFADPVFATLAYFVGFVVPFLVGLVIEKASGSRPKHIRGRELSPLANASKKAESLRSPGEPVLSWGGIELPERFSENHFCVVGATGSGKTATITHLLKSVLSQWTAGSDHRVAIYDAKRDIRSVLFALGVPDERIVMMNPLDARSAAWDIAADVDQPLLTHQIASIIIPPEQGPNKFFSDAGRDIVAGVMKSLMLTAAKRPDGVPDWTLRDVLMISRNESRLRAILSACPATTELVEQYFGGGITFDNIKSTIASNVALIEPIAALWAKSTVKPVSLREWCKAQSVLVIGNDDSLRAPLDAVNRVLFQRLFELLLGQGDSTTRRTWIFVDEVKEAGPLPLLPRLLNKGRSVGARVVIGFQDIAGLHGTYGRDLANELVGMCGNKAILRVDSDETAHWASHAIGTAEVYEYSRSWQVSGSGEQISEQLRTRFVALGDELKDLPVPKAGLFEGYYITPAVGVFKNSVRVLPLDRDKTELNFFPRPVEDQYLEPWGEGDWKRFTIVRDESPKEARQLRLELTDIQRMEMPS